MAYLFDEISCRICLEPAVRSEVIAPCSCTGSQKWVHRNCLDQWRTTREDRAFSKCTECLAPYELIAPSDSAEISRWKQFVFFCYCVRDMILGLAVFNFMTLLFAYWTYSIDKKNDMKFINALHCGDFPKVFYYFMGLFVFLALVGMFGSCLYCASRSVGACNIDACNGCNCDPVYCPLYISDTTSSGCCGGCLNGCGDCACCDAGAAAELGEAGLVLLALAFIIFALIGIFVGVVVGIDFIQKVMRRHIHILRKQSLAQEFVVRDLAEDALDSPGGDVELGDVSDAERLRIMPLGLSSSSSARHESPYVSVSHNMHRGEGPEEEHVVFGNLTAEQQAQLVRLGLA